MVLQGRVTIWYGNEEDQGVYTDEGSSPKCVGTMKVEDGDSLLTYECT